MKSWSLEKNIVFFTFFVVFFISYSFSAPQLHTEIISSEISTVPYSLPLKFNSEHPSIIEYEVKVKYQERNLIVGKETFRCRGTCKREVPIRKVFFDEHSVIVEAYVGRDLLYTEELTTKFKQKESDNKVYLEKNYIIEQNSSTLFTGSLNLTSEFPVQLEVYSNKENELKLSSSFTCQKRCNFSFPFTSTVSPGNYVAKVYLPHEALEKKFSLSFPNKKISSKKKIRKKDKIPSTFVKLPENGTTLEVVDIYGVKSQIKSSKGNISLPQGYSIVQINDSRNTAIHVDTKIHSLESLDNIDSLPLEKRKQKEGFYELTGQDFSKQSVTNTTNPVVFEDDKIYLGGENRFIEVQNNSFEFKDLRKIIPGIYKREKITRYQDGSEDIEENFFAYGLVSINTLKPLYTPNELVEVNIVVLDKWGYLVNNASINLSILDPLNQTISLSTHAVTITPKSDGVYQASFVTENLGTYELYVEAKVNGITVDISSFVNVVEEYPFEIIRNVPVTIDPWLGPFRNTFTVTPLIDYEGTYDFTEVFSADFEIIETDADKVRKANNSLYLTWNNLEDTSKPYYVAQTPLVTPYLYYLGNAWVDYEENERFYENRSWLFAIDPAAKVCDFNSPCICGGSCAGGGEPGAGTIDAATDGNVNYEYVNDIRITSQNASYFGTGDTIEICVDFQCDSSTSGDRSTIGYKGTTAAWVNGDVVQEWQCDNNNLNTFCVNVTLGNTPGTHNIRGKQVWQWTTEPANRISSTRQYRDHDDVNITVLAKVAAAQLSWDLNNGTTIGNGLNVTRGLNITAFAQWSLPLKSAQVEHNGNGTFVNFSIASPYTNNFTNATLDTSNTTIFSNVGIVNVSAIYSQDFYFNLTNSTSPVKYFTMYGTITIDDNPTTPTLEPSYMYQNSSTMMTCRVIDENLPTVVYSGVNVSFFHNVSGYLGSNSSNSTGHAGFTFSESNIGYYAINCSVQSDLPNYLIRATDNVATKILTVKANGTDITAPTITNVNATPQLFSVGGTTNITANVTDDINLTSVYVNVTLPDSSTVEYPLVSTAGSGFVYTFFQTSQDGTYQYYLYATDNSSNVRYTSIKNFEVVGIRTYIGIRTLKDVYKIGEKIELETYDFTQATNASIFYEAGDSSPISYTFDSSDEGWVHSGTQDEWERGVPTDADLNVCESGNCWVTDLDADYQDSANNQILSPTINMSGRTGTQVDFWREIDFTSTADQMYFEGHDGSSWITYYSVTIGATNQEGAFYTYFPSELDNVENSSYRFRMTSSATGNEDGWAFDSFNISFTPRTDWNKSWYTINSSFGLDNNITTAIKIKINITDYNSSGSDTAGTRSPDIQIQVYNGTAYTGDYRCALDSTKTYPFYCKTVIKNTPEYLVPWNISTNRFIRFRAIDLDENDYINWTSVSREVITPSIVENYGDVDVSSYLLQQVRYTNSSVYQVVFNAPVSLNIGEIKNLSNFWNFTIPASMPLGNYNAYAAHTDFIGTVLQNADDDFYINASYPFRVESLQISVSNPLNNSFQPVNFNANLSLDTTFFTTGGWCGYSLDGAANVTMTQNTASTYGSALSSVSIGNHSIIFYCNDTANYFVPSDLIYFNVSRPTLSGLLLNSSSGFDLDADNLTCNYNLVNGSTSSALAWYKDSNPLMLLYLPMEGNSTNALLDYSGNSKHGTNNGATWSGTSGYDSNGSFSFDPPSINSISINNDSIFDLQSEFSISQWIKPEGLTGADRNAWPAVVCKGPVNNAYQISIDSGSTPPFDKLIFRIDSGGTTDVESTTILQNDQWYHIVGVYNTTHMQLYVNGVQEGGDVASGSPDIVGDILYIGRCIDGFYFDGFIDDLRIYNSSLSSAQVLALFQNRSDLIVSQETELGEIWQCRVTPFNLLEAGNISHSNNVTILGTPFIANLNLNSSSLLNISTDNLTCNYDLTSSASSEAVAWYRASQPIMSLYLPMEGNTTTSLLDYSGYGNNATNVGGTFSGSGGIIGDGAYTFDGIGPDNLTVSYVTPELSFSGTDNISIAAWINPQNLQSTTSDARIVTQGNEITLSFATDVDEIDFILNSFTTNDRVNSGAATITTGAWNFVVGTYDGTTIRVYIDGVERSTTVPTGTYGLSTANFGIGGYNTFGFNGSIDDVRIYNYSLSAEQVLALNSSRVDLIVSQETVLNDVWQCRVTPFNALGSGSIVNSNTLTIRNFFAPTLDNFSLTATTANNLTVDNLTCNYDFLGGTTSVAVAWYKNSAPLMDLYFPFDGNSSNALLDYSGSSNNLKNGGATWKFDKGFTGGAFEFNGAVHLDTGDVIGLDSDSTWTLSLFAKSTTNNDNGSGISLRQGSNLNTMFAFYPYDILGGNGTRVWFNGQSLINENGVNREGNNFHHFVFISRNATNHEVFVDGVSVGTSTTSKTLPALTNITIGALYEGVQNYNGYIDNVRVYNFSLSNQQILALNASRPDLIVSHETKFGEIWQCRATPFNPVEAGTQNVSSSLTISELTPTATSLLLNATLLPLNLTTDNLTCNYNLGGDATSSAIAWYKDTLPIMSLYLPFEGNSTNALLDYSGYGNNATSNGGVWNSNISYLGNSSFSFDGIVPDNLSISYVTPELNFSGTDEVTITAWINPQNLQSTTSDARIVTQGNEITLSFATDVDEIDFILNSFTTNDRVNSGAATITTGAWNFVVGTYDGTTIRVYIDGVERSTTVPTGTYGLSTANFGIGGYNTFGFNGSIDDVRIYNYSLSPQQILQLNASRHDMIMFNETLNGEVWLCRVTPFTVNQKGTLVLSNNLTLRPLGVSNLLLNASSIFNLDTDNLICNYNLINGSTTAAITWYKNLSTMTNFYLPIEGGSANAFKDYSGNGAILGLNNGSVSWNATGGYNGNGTLNFNGLNYLTYPDSSILDTGENFTVALWVRTTASSMDNTHIIGKKDNLDSANGWFVTTNADGTAGDLLVVGRNADSFIADLSPCVTNWVTDGRNRWIHLGVAYNKTSVNVYCNGNLVDSGALTLTVLDSTYDLAIGSDADGVLTDNNWTGQLDDIRLYDYKLSAEQIFQLNASRPDLIVSNETIADEIWQCRVTPFDSSEAGLTFNSNNLTIIPLPALGGLLLNATSALNLTSDDLTCNYQLSDGTDTASVAWYKNNVSMMDVYLPMEGNSTNALADFSGVINNATNFNGVVWNSTGGYDGNGSFEFDGIDDFLRIQNLKRATFGNNSNFAFTIWVNIDTCDTTMSKFLEKKEVGAEEISLGCASSDNRVNFSVTDSNTIKSSILSSSTITDSSWHHLAGIKVGNQLELYVDGLLDNSTTTAFTGGWLDGNVTIGYSVDGGNRYANGSLDDVRIYNSSLSAAQVLNLNNSIINVIDSQETKPAETWRCVAVPFNDVRRGVLTYESNNLTIAGDTFVVLNVTSPVQYNKYFYGQRLYLNVTTSTIADSLWFYINGDGSVNYSMTNTSNFIWVYNISSYTPGIYNLTVFGNLSTGVVNSTSVYFYILTNKTLKVAKTIRRLGTDSYNISINLSNFQLYPNSSVHDFVNGSFTFLNPNIVQTANWSITGPRYSGNNYMWNLTVNKSNSAVISYRINGSSDYNILKEYIIGLE